MIYEQPGAAFHSRVDGFDSGLVGTIGVRILDSAGATVVARTTAGIIENPAGSGSYLASLTAPSAPGDYTVFWDNGTVSPGTTSGEQLRVSTSGVVVPAPPAGQFADHSDFAARSGLTLSNAEQTRIDTLLARVASQIQNIAGQKIFQVTDDTWSRSGTSDDRVLLPERPVQSVQSVTLGSVTLAAGADWFRDGDAIVRKTIARETLDALDGWTYGLGFGFEWQTLTVVYTHGYAADEIPGFLKEISCEAVTRAVFNPGSIARQNIAGVNTVFDNNRFSPTGLRLTDEEKAEIRLFFGATKSGSVAVKD